MDAKASIYIPYAFRAFKGFKVSDIKEFQETRHIKIGLGTFGFTGSRLASEVWLSKPSLLLHKTGNYLDHRKKEESPLPTGKLFNYGPLKGSSIPFNSN